MELTFFRYSVDGATRFNANQVDLNRNFPDPVKGDHPDSYIWQTETVAMMEFMKSYTRCFLPIFMVVRRW